MNSGAGQDGKLSTTAKGQSWLSQFRESDKGVATLLLDSVVYITNEQLISGLRDVILGIAETIKNGSIALLTARKNTGEPYWSKPAKRPLSVAARRGVGSEGDISHLCRDLANAHEDILDNPSLDEMRNSHCHTVICVDDIIGSGRRMTSFVEWLHRNKTIRSWRSLGYTKFIACAYAGSQMGIRAVSQHRLFADRHIVQAVGDGRATWSKVQRDAVIALCDQYTEYTRKDSRWALGFEGAFTLLVFPHKCPNTTPAILWASKTGGWTGIFENRPELTISPADFCRAPRARQDRILDTLAHTGLTKPSLFGKLDTSSRELLLLLACVAKRRFKDWILSDIIEVSLPTLRAMLSKCREMGWINDHNRLTEAGRDALDAAKRNDCLQTDNIAVREDFYYPQTFRSPARSSSSALPTRRAP